MFGSFAVYQAVVRFFFRWGTDVTQWDFPAPGVPSCPPFHPPLTFAAEISIIGVSAAFLFPLGEEWGGGQTPQHGSDGVGHESTIVYVTLRLCETMLCVSLNIKKR